MAFSGTPEQIRQLRILLNAGELISSESTVEVARTSFVSVSQHAYLDEEVATLPEGPLRVFDGDENRRRMRLNSNANNNNNNNSHRNGKNMYEGTKKLLVVRVTDATGKSVPERADYVSDKIFGTYNDKITPKSGFDACSFGKFSITNEYDNPNIQRKLSAPGVLDVTIDVRLDETTQNAIVAPCTAPSTSSSPDRSITSPSSSRIVTKSAPIAVGRRTRSRNTGCRCTSGRITSIRR